MKSIRTRLSALLLLAAVATALAIGAVTYRNALKKNEELFDYQLSQIARSLRDQGVVVDPRRNAEQEPFDLVVQIWTADGAMVYLSHPGNPLFDRAMLGFTDVDAGNRRWRVFSMEARDRIIQVAQPFDLRRDLAAAAALSSLAPLLAFAPLMALLIWWLVGNSLAPLRRLAAEVGQRDARSLEQVSEAGLPSEIAPVAHALNSLLERLGKAFASQRAFVADAAHELRSPLTALKLQLQLLARSPDETARKEALGRLHEGVDRAAHLIEQLLTAAQTDPNDRMPALQRCDLAELMRQAIAEVFVLAQARRISIEQEGPDAVMIAADPAALRILARNLLDNAIRYTPQGGAVRVGIAPGGQGVLLAIEDSGPGIAPVDRERAFDRFFRGNAEGETGSGLGLAIVQNIARQHGTEVSLGTSALGGLKVSLLFRSKDGPPLSLT